MLQQSKGMQEREREDHVTGADQSPLSALRIGVPSFNLQGIISTGWKLHVGLYRKQECFYDPAFYGVESSEKLERCFK